MIESLSQVEVALVIARREYVAARKVELSAKAACERAVREAGRLQSIAAAAADDTLIAFRRLNATTTAANSTGYSESEQS